MRIVLKILGFIGAIVLCIVVIAGLQYPEFKIVRTRVIPATPEAIFPWVGNITKWREWSPWVEMDPSMEISYSGPEASVGAIQNWKGQKSGTGSIEFVGYEPNQSVKFKLTFKDWDAVNTGELTLSPEGSGTQVAWTMEGKNNLMARIFWTAFRIEKSMFRDFDHGLELLEKKVLGK